MGDYLTRREVCHLMGEDIHMIAGQLFRPWHFFLSLVAYCKKYLNIALMRQ